MSQANSAEIELNVQWLVLLHDHSLRSHIDKILQSVVLHFPSAIQKLAEGHHLELCDIYLNCRMHDYLIIIRSNLSCSCQISPTCMSKTGRLGLSLSRKDGSGLIIELNISFDVEV